MNDYLEITETIYRYFAALDQRTFDAETFQRLFAKDGAIVRPNGARTVGPDAIRASHATSMERFRATQHLTSGLSIDLTDASHAAFRLNLVAMHLWRADLGDPQASPDHNYFLAGGVVTGSALKTEAGWRLLEIRNEVVWRQGVGFQEMLRTK